METLERDSDSETEVARPPEPTAPRDPKSPLLPHLDQPWGVHAYASALDQLGIVSVTDASGRIIHVNDEFCRISKYSRDELIGRNHKVVNSGHHPPEFFQEMYRTINRGSTWRQPMRNRAKDGSFYWVDALIVPLRNDAQRIVGYLSVRIDITRAVELHTSLHERTGLLQGVVDNFPGGIALFDQNLKMIVCNEMQKRMLDYPDALFASGPPTLEEMFRFNAHRGEYGAGDPEAHVSERLELASQRTPHAFERQRPNGSWLEVRGAPIDGGGFVTTYLDISERKKDQATIARLAKHDALTGLANRVLLRERMRTCLLRVQRGEKMALLYLDLDRFKAVNDTLGHPVGDELLKAVAERLRNATREIDTVARLGGDEFAVVQIAPTSADDVETLARRLIKEICAPYDLGKHRVVIGTSIGIAMAPQDDSDPDQLLRKSDLALFKAKADGRGTYSFFEDEMDRKMSARRSVEQELRIALENGDLKLHFQPIVNIGTRKTTSCEALIRWQHPTRGLIPASKFVPVAEETGMILPIGDWVVKTACAQAANWPDNVCVAVNISPAQFRGQDLADVVIHSLNGLPPSRLIIEITESTLMENNEVTAKTLQKLRSLGVRFALDDFGTGYSSLGYLQSFPFDKIKIDRSFVSRSIKHERSATLLRTIAHLGTALSMATVAEGVETEEQFEMVRNAGCREAQGLLFSGAVSADKLDF